MNILSTQTINTIASLAAYAVSWAAGLYIAKKIAVHQLEKITKKTNFRIDDVMLRLIKNIKLLVIISIAIWLAKLHQPVQVTLNTLIDALLTIAITYQLNSSLNQLIDYVSDRYVESTRQQGPVNLAKIGLSIGIWTVAFLLFLSNAGINITSLVAGLGIGGIAVALAVQNILGDLLSSLSIYFDKPFQVGDFISIGQDKGTVQHIGIKTTRIKTFQGQELIIPNKDITSARVNNFQRMESRKIKLRFGVAYQTSHQKLQAIPKLVEDIFDELENAELNRIHLRDLAESAIIFEGLYTLHTSEYKVYVDTHQQILLDLLKTLEDQEIGLAYPTQTIHLNQLNS